MSNGTRFLLQTRHKHMFLVASCSAVCSLDSTCSWHVARDRDGGTPTHAAFGGCKVFCSEGVGEQSIGVQDAIVSSFAPCSLRVCRSTLGGCVCRILSRTRTVFAFALMCSCLGIGCTSVSILYVCPCFRFPFSGYKTRRTLYAGCRRDDDGLHWPWFRPCYGGALALESP